MDLLIAWTCPPSKTDFSIGADTDVVKNAASDGALWPYGAFSDIELTGGAIVRYRAKKGDTTEGARCLC